MAKKSNCKDCYWGDQCRTNRDCNNYTPLVEDIDNEEYVLQCEERRRKDFYEDWNEYMNEYED